ncbi:hypothetical protein SCG7086_AB_00450 [Chlamydiales bacterium SCGC AG-110-P3]|nr:hypothetical protein SCG7086_AB_00450 [Chlamydiales bacterium SCGC AG-110-P3]
MTEPVVNSADVMQAQQAQQIDPRANPAKAPGGEANSSTMIGSLAELKEKAPDLYKATLKSVAGNIIAQMQRHKERLKKIIRKGEQQ